MYNPRDIIELKGRLKKEDCTVQQFCGCYVDENKNQISRFNSKFLTLPDEEYLKWLDIMKKLFNPKEIYNKNMYLEASGTFDYDFMLDPIQKGKFEENWLDAFYEMTIESVDNVGRFLILLWIDSYDVMKRSSDNLQQDESEEVYTYMTCAICPVDLDKPGLAFNSESKLGFSNKMRQWQIKDPEKLRKGDCLMFRGNDPSRPLQIGHVEMYAGEKKLWGHGSGKPKEKNMESYLEARYNQKASNGKDRGIVEVRRFIEEDPAGKRSACIKGRGKDRSENGSNLP